MNLTPEIVSALTKNQGGDSDPAALIPDGDVLYIAGDTWLLALTRPEDVIDPELLDWIRTHEVPRYASIDWRVLCCKHIDVAQGKFLPFKARQYFDIAREDMFSRVRTSSCRSDLERASDSIFGDVVDLTQLWEQGKARPLYLREASLSGDEVRGGVQATPAAHTFIFEFGTRVVSVNGQYLKAFHDLGLRVTCPVESSGIPVLGLMSEDGDTLGCMKANHGAGRNSDSLGRSTYRDVAHICWISEEAAIAELHSQSCHPLNARYREFDDILGDAYCPRLRDAVGALRWAGWNDGDIEQEYVDGRTTAWTTAYSEAMSVGDNCLAYLEGSERTPYEDRNTQWALKEACKVVTQLRERTGSDLDLGQLPAAVALLPSEGNQ